MTDGSSKSCLTLLGGLHEELEEPVGVELLVERKRGGDRESRREKRCRLVKTLASPENTAWQVRAGLGLGCAIRWLVGCPTLHMLRNDFNIK